jgi:UDP-glucose 4-epimerase
MRHCGEAPDDTAAAAARRWGSIARVKTTVLVTGGAGYVGSHVVAALAAAGHAPIILDDFSNSEPAVVGRVRTLTGRGVPLIEADVRDVAALRRAFHDHPIGAVIHCAGLKAVGEGELRPLAYYDVNVGGTFALAEVMGEAGVGTLVFSSSATVYGQPDVLPVTEAAPLRPHGVYGRTKRTVEDFLRDLARANPNWRVAILRYFNPAGAHPSGEIGEAPRGRPNNLVPLLCRIASGEFAELAVYGSDWPTPDGTGVRDYIHVEDLAQGHIAALDHLARAQGSMTFNLGVGRGTSVLEVVAAFEHACGRSIARTFAPRRPGDVACSYADPSLAERTLGWRATRDIAAICADAWRWQQRGGRYSR